jgi:pantoate--beta-alanine ligase
LKIISSIHELQEDLRNRNKVGFVPTMGAFHEGHLSLMRKARENNDTVVVSLFVNPLQFSPHEDLDKYPRNLDSDAEFAQSVGVDYLYTPPATELTQGMQSRIVVESVSEDFEGKIRPGHFSGVATIVMRLFLIVLPDQAYFGLKDLQQCAVIRTMVKDFGLPVDLLFMETVREQDGLAMSSRNAYLTPEDRVRAPMLSRALKSAASSIALSLSAGEIEHFLDKERTVLSSSGFVVDYFDLVNPETMKSIRVTSDDSRVIAAASIGGVRLLDNVPLFAVPD